ncbi:MAG: YjfB family protein [Lachnospiraceae bacterium]
MSMDIAGLSMALSNVSVSNDVSTAVLSMSLDQYQEMGAEMTKMMERSVTPQLGQNIDLRV